MELWPSESTDIKTTDFLGVSGLRGGDNKQIYHYKSGKILDFVFASFILQKGENHDISQM